MKHRFVTAALVLFGLAAAILAAPQPSHAAAQIILRGVTLVGAVDTTNHTLTVRSTEGTTTTEFTVTYTLDSTTTNSLGKTITAPGTRINGVPRGLTKFTDWLAGDPLTITGKTGTYEGGKLTIAATSIDYQLRNVAIKTFVGTVDNKNSTANQLSVTIKPGALYLLTQVDKVGQSGGPALSGAADVNGIALGSSVKLVQVWRPDPATGKTMKFKDLSVTMLVTPPPTAVVRVLHLTQATTGSAINITAGFTMPLTLNAGNKVALQNETTQTIFLKVRDSDRASFTANLANGYAMIRAGGVATLATKAAVSTEAFGQPITTLRKLTLTRLGSGSVTAKTDSDTIPGINCGSTCNAPFADGASVIFTATKGTGATFSGWSGACSGTGTCTVTMDGDKVVTATFGTLASSYGLTVTKVGSGTVMSGEVTPKINCGTACSAILATNSNIVLTATPASGYTFTGWSIPCSGATCTVTIDGAKSITATFSAITHTLSVTPSSVGKISGLGGINCGSACSASLAEGTSVTLNAYGLQVGSTCHDFSSWGGDCNGQPNATCTITMNANKSVSASYVTAACQ